MANVRATISCYGLTDAKLLLRNKLNGIACLTRANAFPLIQWSSIKVPNINCAYVVSSFNDGDRFYICLVFVLGSRYRVLLILEPSVDVAGIVVASVLFGVGTSPAVIGKF